MRKLKDSGLSWIGKIPENWKIVPHKHLMHKVKELKEHYEGEDIISLTMNGVIIRDFSLGGKMPTTFDGYQKVYPGNLLMCLFDIDVTPRCIGLINNFGLTSPAYSQFVMHDGASSRYYNYLLRYIDDYKCLLHLSKNLRSSLTETDFGQISTCLPPIDEQEKIASFLDEKCSEIDSLISLQDDMITKLQEYKQSVITEAVTRGLDPSVPMKDSGIEWIGMIPETFQLLKLGRVIGNYKAGPFGSSLITGKLLHDGDILVYTPEHIARQSTSISNNLFLQKERIGEMQQFFVKPKDIIFPIVGSLGRAMVIDDNMPNGIINQRLSKFNLDENIVDLRYFMWCFGQSEFYKTYIEINCRGAIIVNLTKQLICAMPLVCPSLDEQHEIADFLDRKCSEIDALIDIKKQKIETLKEYKKSLIFECVTGKREIA